MSLASVRVTLDVLMPATEELRAERCFDAWAWVWASPCTKICGSHNPMCRRSSSHVIRPSEGMISQHVSLQSMLVFFVVSFFLSFCSSPCECYLFNSLPRVVCCFESICKTESRLGSPSLNVDLLGIALMTLKGGITKCKVRHDLHSLLCWQKCCMNMMIWIGWIRQEWETNAER